MANQRKSKSHSKHLAQLLVILAVLFSFSVEMTSKFFETDCNTIVLEELGNESDSEGKIDFEIDTEGEKSHNQQRALDIDWLSTEICLAQVSNLGLANALSPLLQLDAPPPEV